ncbi:hypothetical protein [Allobranchiibius sp. GilTou38]|uniref:hypothetical protein n=1 Tax=Allobranchiibius sp. GilTou38 TaxID=2815210 RepID=UPI001AA10635|nr:hypothetical protein [Allobranchiibius sp. GilTou38]MBO1767795.1 hypothetical protein [Allobranchiibius sp. GilTou38]
MSRRSVALAAIPLTLALGAATAGHADAAVVGHHQGALKAFSAKVRTHADGDAPVIGSCSLIVPATARVVQPEYQVPVRVTGGCALHPGPNAAWIIGSEENPSDFILFDDQKSTTWDMYDDTPLGTHTWAGDGAYDENFDNAYSQNSPQTTTKVGSWAGLNTSRSGSRVTLSTHVVRYSTADEVNIPWAGETGVIQYKTVGGSTWTGLKDVVADKSGNYSWSYTSSAARDYRVVYKEATYIWGATSPTSRR